MSTPIRRNPTVFPYRGKWRLTFVDRLGKTHSKSAATRQDAYNMLITLGIDEASGRNVPSLVLAPTLEVWLERWFVDSASELRIKTIRNHRSIADRHVLPELGQYLLTELTTVIIEGFYRRLMSDKGLSASTVHRIHAVLSLPLKTAVRHGILSSNPLEAVRKPKRPTVRVTPLNLGDTKRVLEFAATLGAAEHLRWLLALRLGLRQGETLALTWDDFDMVDATVTISKQVQRHKGHGFVLSPPKSDQGFRTLPLDAEAMRVVLEAHRQRKHDCTLVFPSRDGQPRHSSTDRKAWLRLLQLANVTAVPLHAARHTAATRLVEAGIDIRSVQVILGHSSPSFTMATYVHPGSQHLRNAIDTVSSTVNGT